MGWCGYTIEEATGGQIRESCSGEEFNLQAGRYRISVKQMSWGQRKLPQGFFTLP